MIIKKLGNEEKFDFRVLLILVFVVFIIIGLMNKEWFEVLKNAVLICFSCIGID